MVISERSIDYIMDNFVQHYVIVQEELKKENKDPDELARSMALTEVQIYNQIMSGKADDLRDDVHLYDTYAKKNQHMYLKKDHTKVEATLTDWTAVLTIREYLNQQGLQKREKYMLKVYQLINAYEQGIDHDLLEEAKELFDEQFPKLH